MMVLKMSFLSKWVISRGIVGNPFGGGVPLKVASRSLESQQFLGETSTISKDEFFFTVTGIQDHHKMEKVRV